MRFTFVFVVLILSQAFIYFQFLSYIKTLKWYKKSYAYYTLIPFVLFNVPFIILSTVSHGNINPPGWFKSTFFVPFYIWECASIMILPWLLVGKIIKAPFLLFIWISKLFKPVKIKIEALKNKRAVKTVDLSRRKFVRYSTFAVASYAFLGSGYGVVKHNAYQIDYEKIKISNLPEEFKGMTITLLSDIHAGQFMDENDMKEYCEVVNGLGSDVVCIPGDFVNFDRTDSHMVARAFKDMKAKYGIYGSLGNHDFFQDADYVAEVMVNESPVKMLRNNYQKITINQKDLFILGVDDIAASGVNMNRVIEYLDSLIIYLNENEKSFATSPKILLCHKPYAFDTLAAKNLDLVFAGHTHGGQVVPVKLGDFDLSFAAFVSKYIAGLYNIGKSNMYVSRGIGTVILPIRLNCSPEVTKITLI